MTGLDCFGEMAITADTPALANLKTLAGSQPWYALRKPQKDVFGEDFKTVATKNVAEDVPDCSFCTAAVLHPRRRAFPACVHVARIY